MQGYKNKTEGSRIEMKETSIIWNYANTDLEFGQMQGKELCSYLRNVFEHLPIEIIETKTYIQVVLREMKKVSSKAIHIIIILVLVGRINSLKL